MDKKIILSGMRPTGKLHIGHWVGALSNWVQLQKDYTCFFMVADWHSLMSEYKFPEQLKEYVFDNVCDWLSFGIDPESSAVFVQSEVPEHLELFFILSVLTPLGWLYRCPTYKDQIKQLQEKEVNTYSFLGYPVLQAADILIYKATHVPVGQDQLPHLELCREIARKFNFLYKKDVLVQPQALLTKDSRLLGLDGRKMSKSYGNSIYLDDSDEEIDKKVMSMITDPARIKKDDPGHPEVCNVFSYYKVFSPQRVEDAADWCSNAKKGCVACKRELAESLKVFLAPSREKKKEILKKKDYIYDILKTGRKKAQSAALTTVNEVKKAMNL
ncbi:MAG: tryptophan--tRNA ligase [Candidatus Omnitrophica bacterium]|nr:tryptophan--tRNA ligase [Candidatus Omnitrophota bacterium]